MDSPFTRYFRCIIYSSWCITAAHSVRTHKVLERADEASMDVPDVLFSIFWERVWGSWVVWLVHGMVDWFTKCKKNLPTKSWAAGCLVLSITALTVSSGSHFRLTFHAPRLSSQLLPLLFFFDSVPQPLSVKSDPSSLILIALSIWIALRQFLPLSFSQLLSRHLWRGSINRG